MSCMIADGPAAKRPPHCRLAGSLRRSSGSPAWGSPSGGRGSGVSVTEKVQSYADLVRRMALRMAWRSGRHPSRHRPAEQTARRKPAVTG